MAAPDDTRSHLITLAEWRSLRAAAAELDLLHGGAFRARGSRIQFFCSPENAPEEWDLGFPDGSPDVPRACVGEAQAEALGGGQVRVRLCAANWHALRRVKQAYDQGSYTGRFQEYVRAQQTALRGRPEDMVWLERQFARLRDHASGRLLSDSGLMGPAG